MCGCVAFPWGSIALLSEEGGFCDKEAVVSLAEPEDGALRCVASGTASIGGNDCVCSATGREYIDASCGTSEGGVFLDDACTLTFAETTGGRLPGVLVS